MTGHFGAAVPELVLECAASTKELKGVRSAVRDWLGVVGQPVGDWDVVVTELLCNAINATDGETLALEMQILPSETSGQKVQCTVRNEGEWELDGIAVPAAIDYVMARHTRPSDELPTGRGLRMVCALTSGGLVEISEGQTSVVVWLDVPAPDRVFEGARNSSVS